MTNYPPGTWGGDPLAPWNQPEWPPTGACCGNCAKWEQPPTGGEWGACWEIDEFMPADEGTDCSDWEYR